MKQYFLSVGDSGLLEDGAAESMEERSEKRIWIEGIVGEVCVTICKC